jgi:hypothetical protein
MLALTRKRVNDRPITWHIHYAGVRVGVIIERSGAPPSSDQWRWCCGFYPGSKPSDDRHGTAATFETARVAFEAAWRDYLPKCSEADFRAWRDQRDWTARKYSMWERGERMPSQKPGSLMKCPCGEKFDSHRLEDTVLHVPHITAAHRTESIRR